MGSIFVRGQVLWLKYKKIDGEWTNQSSGYRVGQERKAKSLLRKTEARIEARIAAGERDDGPLTVQRYGEQWLDKRTTNCVKDDRARLTNHVFPVLGDELLAEIRPRNIKALVDGLIAKMKKEEIAPRTVRHVYGVLHTMFEQAVEDELLESNPCVLKRGYLPKKRDKDPLWRPSAKFNHEEVERLISDARVPEDMRAVCALLALTGARFGEMAALQWSSYEPKMEPLGRLVLARSYDFKNKRVKGTKTERPREVPVHPTLAKVLAAWKLGGWQRLMGRSPKSEDLIFPAVKRHLVHGVYRSPNEQLPCFHAACDALKIRKRRIHDLRRTFISLARDDGALRDVIQWITHAPDGDVLDSYTTPAWSLLCQEVSKLKIFLRSSADNVVSLPPRQVAAASVSDGGTGRFGTVLGTVGRVTARNTNRGARLQAKISVPGTGLEPVRRFRI
jgi:integrase